MVNLDEIHSLYTIPIRCMMMIHQKMNIPRYFCYPVQFLPVKNTNYMFAIKGPIFLIEYKGSFIRRSCLFHIKLGETLYFSSVKYARQAEVVQERWVCFAYRMQNEPISSKHFLTGKIKKFQMYRWLGSLKYCTPLAWRHILSFRYVGRIQNAK